MNLPDTLNYIFGEDADEIVLYDEASDKEAIITSFETAEEVIKDFKEPFIDLVSADGMCFGYTSKEGIEPTFTVETDQISIPVYLLDVPVHEDTLQEEDFTEIPAPSEKWKFVEGTGILYTKEELESSPEEIPEPEEATPETQKMNDATVVGIATPEMVNLLAKPFVFSVGDLYDMGDRRNTQDGAWKRVELPLINWLNGKDDWGLNKHPVGASKQGQSLVLADTVDGARKDAAIHTMYAIGIDVDSGATLESAVKTLEKEEIFAVVYSTFNHKNTKLVLKHDDVVKKLQLDDTPTRPEIQEYLRSHHKDRYNAEFIDSIKVVDARHHTTSGMKIILETAPLEKFRIIFPLAEPVQLSELATTLSQWKTIWEDKVCGVAHHILDIGFDATSCDVNRLFYTPRHAEGAEWESYVVQGKPLVFENIKPHSKMLYLKNRDVDNVFGVSHEKDFQERTVPQCFAPSGESLNKWHNKAKSRFMIADVLEAYCEDRVRSSGSTKMGTCHIECPFEHEHSEDGGTATMAMNPPENENDVWTVFCHHDSCKDSKNKLEFLEEMLKNEWFPESILKDEDFLIPLEDEEEEKTPVTSEDVIRTPAERAGELPSDATEERIEKFIGRLHKEGVDRTVRAAVNDVLATRTLLNKRELQSIWKNFDNAARLEAAERAREDLSDFDGTPVVNDWGFGDMCEYAKRRIQDVNAKDPRLFHYIDDIARIEDDAEGNPRITILSRDQFGAELDNISKWHNVTYVGETERTREVAAPLEVVRHLFNSKRNIYPQLRGMVTTPIFSAKGDLMTTPGFHSKSGLFYWPDITLDIPEMNPNPSKEEIYEAKRLLIEEVLADFPLGGLSRPEIIEQALKGEGVPAVTHCIGLLLLMFCREMIKGPTPGHLATKPAPGTGASLLIDACSTIATGRPTPAVAIPKNPEEMAKTLITLMMDGSNMIYFDNISANVDSGELASAMTAPRYKARLLGKSQSIETEVRCAWVFTGNNVQLSGELIRRLVMIDLDARMAHPEQRNGFKHKDLPGWVSTHRGALVGACLTLIQGWIAAGQPEYTGDPLNSYENWSKVIGGITEHAGLGGFLQNRDYLNDIASDDSDEDVLPFLDTWWETFKEESVIIGTHGNMPSLTQLVLDSEVQVPVRTRKTIAGDLVLDSRSFGQLLNHFQKRVFELTDGTEVSVMKSDKRCKYGNMWQLKPAQAS